MVLRDVLLGEKEPLPLVVQIPVVLPPATVPLNATLVLFEQMD